MNSKAYAQLIALLLILPLIPSAFPYQISPAPIGIGTTMFGYSSNNKAVILNDAQYIFYMDGATGTDFGSYIYKATNETEWSTRIQFTAGGESPNGGAGTLSAVSDGNRILVSVGRGSSLGVSVPYVYIFTSGSDKQLVETSQFSFASMGFSGGLDGSMSVGYNSSGFPIVAIGTPSGNTLKVYAAIDTAGSNYTQIFQHIIGSTIGGTSVCSMGNGDMLVTVDQGAPITGIIYDQATQTPNDFVISSSGTTGNRQAVCDPANQKAYHYYKDSSNAGRAANISISGTVGAETVINTAIETVSLSIQNNTGNVYYFTGKDNAVYMNITNTGGTLIGNGQFNIVEVGAIDDMNAPPTFYSNQEIFTAFRIGTSDMGYSVFSTNTNPIMLKFRDSLSQQVTPQNITLLRFSDNTETTYTASGPDLELNLQSGYYQAKSLFRNNVDLLDNETKIFITPAFNAHVIIVHNATITFNFVDEVTLQDYTAPKNLTLYFGNTSELNYQLGTNTSFQVGVAEIPDVFSVSFGEVGEFYRWGIMDKTAYNQTFKVYLPNYTSYQVNNYVFEIQDALNQYSQGSVEIRKPTPDGLVTVSHSENNLGFTTVPLIQDHRYRITAHSSDGSKSVEIGNYIPTAILDQSLVVTDISFSTNLELSQKFIRWSAQKQTDSSTCPSLACAINVRYLDLTGSTTSLTITIINGSGIQYTTNVASSNYSLIWTGASTNITLPYWVDIISVSNSFGTLTDTTPAFDVVQLLGMPRVNLGFSSNSCNPTVNPNTDSRCVWYSYISIGLILFVLGLFGAASAPLGALLGSLTSAMVYYFGWFQASPILIGVGVLFSIIYMFGNRRIAN
tara:strand:+ start:860 stop:3394 length:2535 start_codon:yes stop_codon:yes gene_type:complete